MVYAFRGARFSAAAANARMMVSNTAIRVQ
jgi:hypothetical protein